MKPANFKENRVDRRLACNQTGKRRVVVAMRERNGRTLPFVFASKSASIATIAERVDADAVIHADEAAHWDKLHAIFLTKRVNHEWAYSHDEACTEPSRKLLFAHPPRRDGPPPSYQRPLSRRVFPRNGVARGSSSHFKRRTMAYGYGPCASASGISPVERVLAGAASNCCLVNTRRISALMSHLS